MLEEDIFAARGYAKEGKLTFKQWAGSLRGVEEMQWFAPDDPMPFLVWCWIQFGIPTAQRIRRIGRRILATLTFGKAMRVHRPRAEG